jgi:SHS2 domain-containing protein
VYRWIEHTAELELVIEAETEAAIFEQALAAFKELVANDNRGETERHTIELEDERTDELLADWLDELVYLADAGDFVPERVTSLELNGGRLRATVEGHRGKPGALVKAVTRHRLALEPAGEDGWRARMVLDV